MEDLQKLVLDGLGLTGLTDDSLMIEATALIKAGQSELRTAGVDTNKEDPLINIAILYYVKANWGFDNPDKEFFEKRYDRLKAILSLDSETRLADAVE